LPKIIIEALERRNISPVELAEMEAERRFLRTRVKSKQKRVKNTLFSSALRIYKKNLIPKSLVKFYAPRYFKASLD